MAAYRSSSSANSLTSSVVVTKPTGAVSGDALTIIIAAAGVGAIVPPAGWTLFGSQTTVGAFLFAFYGRLLGGSEPSTYTFTSSGASAMLAIAVDASGTKLGYGQSAITTGTATTAYATSSITTFQPNAYVLTIFQDISGVVTWTTPTGETNRIAVSGGAANDQIQASAGSTGTKSSTASATTSGVAFIVSIEEQPVLSASGGNYTITGATATLKVAHVLAAAGGSYALTGANATLKVAHQLAASGGSYSLTGAAATLLYNHRLTATGGTYAVTGASAGLIVSHLLNASNGSYAVTGSTASLKVGHILIASGSSYLITGVSTTLIVARKLSTSGGVYTMTGLPVTFTISGGTVLNAGSGSYALTGSPVTFVYTPNIPSALTGLAAWTPICPQSTVQGLSPAVPVSLPVLAMNTIGSITPPVSLFLDS